MIALAAAAALAIACDGGDDARVDPGPPCTNEATAEAWPRDRMTRTPGDPRRSFIADDENHCRLRRGLLTLEDLPAGWTITESDYTSRYQASPFFCDVPLPRTNAGVRVVFNSESSGLMHELYVFDGTSAEDVIDALERSCPAAERYLVTEGPAIGERSIWLADATDGTTSGKLILFSHGETLAVLSVPEGNVDATEVAHRAASRLDTLAPLASATPWPQMTCDDPVREPRGRSAELQQLLPAIETLPAGFVRAEQQQCQFADDHDCFEPLEPRGNPRAEASSGFYAWPASSVGFSAWEFSDGDARDVLDEWREVYDGEWVCESNPDISHRVVETPASPDDSFAVMTTEQRSGGGDVARYLGVIADDDMVVIVQVAYETFETRARQRPATPDDEIVAKAVAAAKASLAKIQAED